MNDNQLLRYSRHILLDDIGIEGQQSFIDAHALIIGAGGLGCPAAIFLAASGVGKITLVDADTVDMTNLQRQIGHTTARIGMPKVDSLKETLLGINPEIGIQTYQCRADQQLLDTLVPQANVVLDCTDNYKTRHAINAACVKSQTPLVAAAVVRMDGQISVFDPKQPDAPCYACLFPAEDEFEEVQCSMLGVFAPLVGIMGSMQAAEALKVIGSIGTPLNKQLLILDGLAMEWTRMRTHKNPDCPVCCKKL